MAIFENIIGGERVGSTNVSRNINPSNTDDVLGEYAQGTRQDAERAIAAAKTAFRTWSCSGIQERYDCL